MRLIDADDLIIMEFGNIQFVPKEFIDNALTIDAVEVVRCKGCYNYSECEYGLIKSLENGYCYFGERIE